MCDVTVVIPTIPPRAQMLTRALASVESQTHPAAAVIVEHDHTGEGPAVIRNRALGQVVTEWVAFLDDDDYLLPDHLAVLCQGQEQSGADVVWPWFRVQGGTDPFPMHRGRQWDPQDPHQIPITVLARTDAIRAVGGFQTIPDGPTDRLGNRAGEDWTLWLALSSAGYQFHHVNRITWVWCHGPQNTSGLPSRWLKQPRERIHR